MRLLILSHNYAPEATGIGPYTTELAEHLVGSGHSVTVLTTFPHYPRYKWHAKPGLLEREYRAGVYLRRARVVLPRRSTAFWRIVFDSSVGLASLLNSVGLPRPDLVIGVVPTVQNGLSACLLASRWRVPGILLIKDLPVEAGLAVGMLRRNILYKAGTRFERHVYRKADWIVVIGEHFRRALIAKGVNPETITVISDWADLESIKPSTPDPKIRRNLTGSENGFLVVHAGSMGEKQGLLNVVAAAKQLADAPEIVTLLVGNGPTRPSIQAEIAKHRVINVRLLDVQPPDEFLKILGAADAFVINQRPDVVDAVVPSKLLTYMAAGKPVIAAVNPSSVAAELVSDAGCGVVVAAEDPAALAGAIRTLYANADLRASFGRRAREYAASRFDKAVVLRRWNEFLTASRVRRRDKAEALI